LAWSSVRRTPDDKGFDLFVWSLIGVDGRLGSPIRVNDRAGDVSDHGENSPQVLASPDHRWLYAAWGTVDPKDSWGGSVRFARSPAQSPAFSPALTINDDRLPVSYAGFQTMAVGSDGTIYIVWLDGREGVSGVQRHAVRGADGIHQVAETSGVYIARSTDQGRTFSKNILIARHICPCCRPSIGFVGDRIVVGFRMVESGDIRDMHVAMSSDKGRTWSAPTLVARDGWKINGCPHVGPSIAAVGSTLYVAWMTAASGEAVINVARSTDGGKTFSTVRGVSATTVGATHPMLAANPERAALVFEARPKAGHAGMKARVYYREFFADGSMSELSSVSPGQADASYPSVSFDNDAVLVSWTQSERAGMASYVTRGRVPPRPLHSSRR
jgi:hypothetical protein